MTLNRFDNIPFDTISQEQHRLLKAGFLVLERHMDEILNPGRAKSLAMTGLEEAFVWVGKAIRDNQYMRTEQETMGEGVHL